jgi:DNA-binding NarL/FixJ family response regulator
MTRVMIVENDPLAMQLFTMFVEKSGRYELVHTLESAAYAEAYCRANPVDLILMDICTNQGASGLSASAKIKQRLPGIKIIIVTSQPECDFINRARAGGVDSFWYKTIKELELLEVMDRTMAGESIYPDSTPQISIGHALSGEFTPRELDVLRELTGGDTNAEIAERLGLSVGTVRNHIQRMLEKSGLGNRTALAVAAGKSGLVNREF